MTTHEIIDETVAWYRDHPRSKVRKKSGGMGCAYIGPDGERCAFSRCCELDDALILKFANLDNSDDGGALSSYFSEKEFTKEVGYDFQKIIQEKYRGHSIGFWVAIQQLHDDDAHWKDPNGGDLTEQGLKFVEGIKKRWPVAESKTTDS